MRQDVGAAVAAGLVAVAAAHGQTPPTMDASGTVHAPALTVPVSSLLTPEARAAFIARYTAPAPSGGGDIVGMRAAYDAFMFKPALEKWRAIYTVDIAHQTIAGVPVDVVTPTQGGDPRNKDRVLINLHGGGFVMGAGLLGQVESVPLAGRGRIKVISVDYRQGPENRFPAGSEDVAKVYRALLKIYPPENIGVYGGSAGGMLTAEAIAWFRREGLPAPGVIGLFASGGVIGGVADSSNLGRVLTGQPPLALTGGGVYFQGCDLRDPLVSPALYAEEMSHFPPTLVVTGTRDFQMSNAVFTHAQLLKAGRQSQLLVQEGFGHGDFAMLAGTPESKDAYDIIWRFFDTHLGRKYRG